LEAAPSAGGVSSDDELMLDDIAAAVAGAARLSAAVPATADDLRAVRRIDDATEAHQWAFTTGPEGPSHRSLLLREDPGAECHRRSGSANAASFVTDGGHRVSDYLLCLTGLDGVVAKAVLRLF
jgi:hypothetical protein